MGDSTTGTGNIQAELEHPIMPQSKKVLKKNMDYIHIDYMGYNPKHKMNIHEHILIWINDLIS